MLFRTLRGGRDADPLGRRMRRARKEGALCGRREAKLFRLAVRRAADRAKAIDWLNTAVSEGRAELEGGSACLGACSRGLGHGLPCGLHARDRLTLR
jgi:hypothetical protein